MDPGFAANPDLGFADTDPDTDFLHKTLERMPELQEMPLEFRHPNISSKIKTSVLRIRICIRFGSRIQVGASE
jgi:hypothetical protein